MCMLDQCYNEGTCISDPLSPYGYRCKCPPGIVGNECQIGTVCSSFKTVFNLPVAMTHGGWVSGDDFVHFIIFLCPNGCSVLPE